jgi:hypothetical protein
MANESLAGKHTLADQMRKIKEELNADELTIKSSLPEKPINVPIKKEPKLFVTGRLDRKKHEYTITSLALLTKIEQEIKAYCNGGDLVVLNYLIKEGLKKVKESPHPITIDMTDIESF